MEGQKTPVFVWICEYLSFESWEIIQYDMGRSVSNCAYLLSEYIVYILDTW